jgi:septal ring factor EnvC (AmiA/AmiB activator)
MTNVQVVKFDPPKAIEAVKNKVAPYAGLKITGMDDKEGYEKVRVAIGECVSTRTEFVATCKAARDDANKYAKFVIEQERIGVDEIEKVELALKAEKAKIDDEKARIKAEKEAKEAARVQALVDKLAAVGFAADPFDIAVMDAETFAKLLAAKTEEFRIAEEARVAAEAKAKADAEELEKLRAEKAQMEEERRKLEEEKAKIEREKELEAAKKEAAEKAAKETEERLKREAEAKAESERLAKEKEEAERKAAEERLAKEQAYKDFLAKNGVTKESIQDGTHKVIQSESTGTILVYELKDTFKIPA